MGLAHLAFHLGAIILFGAMIATRVPFWPMWMVPQGILIVFLFTLLGLPTWYGHVKTLGANASSGRGAARTEARLMIALYLALAGLSFLTGSTLLLYSWIIPAIIGQPALRLSLLAEHTGCPKLPNMLDNTRTVLTNRLIRLIAWNMHYHTEHHTYPAVPFHRLPELHSVMADRLRHVEPGYASFHRGYLRSLVSR